MLRRHPRKSVSRERLPFCAVCGLWPHLCVCAELPPSRRLGVELIVLQHFSESRRQSNSGRLAASLVPGSRVVPWGWPGVSFDDGALAAPGAEVCVLFPQADATPLDGSRDARRASGGRTALVLLDATWSQARSMARRVPGLDALPFVTLAAGAPARFTLRRSPHPGTYSTLEAAVRAVEALEGADAARPLWRATETVLARSLHMRGKIDARELRAREARLAAAADSRDPG